ncbi:phytanoyl-CoA dioxygenase, peroxisomal-like [Fopius arisanus]|uniref:phytanoyl-CoA dioxygenase n=1 Tax=Fopius arisanus TaxID=64838 RepID=A0A9R1TZE8_9HYME|nr:PREDICTED: phytanoyl-CoA dioxygenase, peroxisomal-like [Fopius arisanus]
MGLKCLTPEQKKFYVENGFVKLSGILTPREFEEISEAYDDIFTRKQRDRGAELESSWKGTEMSKLAKNRDYTVKSVHALQLHSAAFTRLLMHPRLLDALEDIMETPNILLHHTKAHLKPPETGAPYLMHQDYPYFPFKNHSMVAVFLHLDDTTPENGGLAVYPGSHKLGPLKPHTSHDEHNGTTFYVDPQKFPLAQATPISAKKGEIVIFSYLLLHGSYLNLSERPRRMFLAQIRAADDEATEDVHKSPCHDMVLRGKNIRREAKMKDRYIH